MSDNLTVARDRARNVVGDSVWEKLSETARTNGIKEELRLMAVERDAAACAEFRLNAKQARPAY